MKYLSTKEFLEKVMNIKAAEGEFAPMIIHVTGSTKLGGDFDFTIHNDISMTGGGKFISNCAANYINSINDTAINHKYDGYSYDQLAQKLPTSFCIEDENNRIARVWIYVLSDEAAYAWEMCSWVDEVKPENGIWRVHDSIVEFESK